MRKRGLPVGVLVALALRAVAAEPTLGSMTDTPEAFVAAMKSFQPSTTKSWLGYLFSMADSDGHEGQVHPKQISTCDLLWADERNALVFATVRSEDLATRGVLFYLHCTDQKKPWSIQAHREFTAFGSNAALHAVLSNETTNNQYRLGRDGLEPIITIKKSEGGRGYCATASASYTIDHNELRRVDLE